MGAKAKMLFEESPLLKIVSYLGSGISRPFTSRDIGIQVLRSNNVKNGRIVTNDIKYWYETDPRGADLSKVTLRTGDLIVNFVNGSRSELGKAALYEGTPPKCIVSTNFFIVRFRPEVMRSRFACYFFQSDNFQQWLQVVAGFTGQGSFNQRDFGKMLLPVPPLLVQDQITSILSTWDRAIDTVSKLIDAKTRLKKGLMQQLLKGKRRFPGFEGEWETFRLDDLFDERKERGNPTLPMISITGKRGVISRDEVDRKDTSNADKSKYLRITPGDIGYNTMRMWQGVSGLSTFEGIVSPAYTILVPKNNVVGRFAAHLFKFPRMIHLFHRYSQGLVNDTLNLKYPHFSQIRVTVPSAREQKRIADILDSVDSDINHLVSVRNMQSNQKRGLMQLLLKGKVRVKVQNGGDE